MYQIGIAPNRIDIMMDIPGVSFAVAWKNRVESTYDQEPIHVMGLEELIAAKRTSNREQDRLDLRNLVAKKKKGQRCQR